MIFLLFAAIFTVDALLQERSRRSASVRAAKWTLVLLIDALCVYLSYIVTTFGA